MRGCLQGLLAADAGLPGAPASAASPEAELALYTVDGLVEALQWANDGVAADETACLWLAYLRWARLRGLPVDDAAPAAPARPLDALLGAGSAVPDSPAARALTLPEMGTPARPVNSGAEDDGALLRSLPAGLIPHVPAAAARQIAQGGAALTHGHPLPRQVAGLLAAVVHGLAAGLDPAAAAAAAADGERAAPGGDDLLADRIAAAGQAGAAGTFPAAASGSGQGGERTAARRADDVAAAAVQAVAAAARDAAAAAEAEAGAEGVFAAAVAGASVGGPVAAAAAGALVGAWLGEDAVPAVPGGDRPGRAAALEHVVAELVRVTGA